MRKCRVIETCRCYHLISRLAHQAFFLDDGEKTRAVELLRRVEEFCGVIVLAYAIMTNHFHVYVYVPDPEEIDDDEILRRINVLYRDASLSQVLGEWARLKDEEEKLLEHARAARHVADLCVHRCQRMEGWTGQSSGGLRMVQFRRCGQGSHAGTPVHKCECSYCNMSADNAPKKTWRVFEG